MNAKTIKKILMRNRVRVFWGRRAFITVRFPLSVIPEPPPPPIEPPGESVWGGMWKKVEGDVTTLTNIAEYSSSGDPRRREYSEKRPSPIYDVRFEQYGDEDSGTYHWWETEVRVFKGDSYNPKNLVEVRAGDEAFLRQYQARKAWVRKYLNGTEGPTDVPVLDALLGASYWAKTTYSHVDETRGYAYITYSVKWFYPNYKRKFSSDLAKAMKFAKRQGVSVRVLAS